MKTPIRLAIAAFSLIMTLFTFTTQIFTSPSYSRSSAILRSRGYLPQSILSWTNYGADQSKTTSDSVRIEKSNDKVIENQELEKIRIQEELGRIEKGWSKPEKGQEDKIIIMGKMHDDYTDWVEKELPDWQRAIFTVDALNLSIPLSTYTSALPPGHFTTPAGLNKGREALPYLTYIISNYHNPYLPSTLVFIHPHRDGYPRAWHTDSPGHSQPAALKSLRLDYIQQQGYVNLRCNGDPGCPAEVRPLSPSPTKEPEAHMAAAWAELWPERIADLPEIIAAPCCAQFAVSRAAVLAQPLEHYVRIRDWLVKTELSDYVSGRVMEYLWHIVFGKEAVSCPSVKTCYCDLYGRRCPRGREKNRAALNTGPPPGVQGVAVWGRKKEEVVPAVLGSDDVAGDFGEAKAEGVKMAGGRPAAGDDLGPDPYVPGLETLKLELEAAAIAGSARTLPLPDTPFSTSPEIERGELEATGHSGKAKLPHDFLSIPDPRTDPNTDGEDELTDYTKASTPAHGSGHSSADIATAAQSAEEEKLAEHEAQLSEAASVQAGTDTNAATKPITFMSKEEKASLEAVMGTKVQEFDDGTVEVGGWFDGDNVDADVTTRPATPIIHVDVNDAADSGSSNEALYGTPRTPSDVSRLDRMREIQDGLRKKQLAVGGLR